MQKKGISNIICTDISRDGMLGGTNIELYRALSEKYSIDITASGGVSTLSDIKTLCAMDMYGAILGKALYAGALEPFRTRCACAGRRNHDNKTYYSVP